MMEKEALTHNIKDDLDARNRNWEKVDSFKEDFNSQKEDYTNYQGSNNLKVATVERELNNYKSTMAGLNPNQEVKQKATGYGVVSLPKNAASGQVSVSVKGNTIAPKNKVRNGNGEEGVLYWTLADSTKFSFDNGYFALKDSSILHSEPFELKSGLNTIQLVGQVVNAASFSVELVDSNNVKVGNSQYIGTSETTKRFTVDVPQNGLYRLKIAIAVLGGVAKFKQVLCYEGDITTPIYENWISRTKSTISAMRLKSVSEDESEVSTAYVTAKDNDNEIAELRSLPNGAKDEIRVSGGKAEHIKRIDDDGTAELASPIVIPINVSGGIVSNPSGTIYIEPVVADAGMYIDKLNVLNIDLPINYIEKLSKVDFNTGVETEIDPSKCVVTEDKISFTHPDLTSNDIVFFTYFHNLEGAQGETTIEYYDSRHTLKDSVTGKFYKVVPAVEDGILINELVEV